MANSLRAKISKLRHDGNITNEEYQEIISKLDGHDKQVRADERIRLEKAFEKLYGSEYSWSEVVELSEKLNEQKNCNTCANATKDFNNEVDNGCYMCCKGYENNYIPKEQK